MLVETMEKKQQQVEIRGKALRLIKAQPLNPYEKVVFTKLPKRCEK